MQELLVQVQDERVIPNVAASLEQIEATTKSFELLTVRLQDELVKAAPVIRNLEVATAHINNIVASLDNPQTLSELNRRPPMPPSSPPRSMPWVATWLNSQVILSS